MARCKGPRVVVSGLFQLVIPVGSKFRELLLGEGNFLAGEGEMGGVFVAREDVDLGDDGAAGEGQLGGALEA